MKVANLMRSLVASTLLTLAIGCGGSNPAAPDVRELTLHFEGYAGRSLGMVVGSTIKVVADVRDGSGQIQTGAPVAFSSTQPSIANVSSAGAVSALAMGSCYIVAVAQGRTGSFRDSVSVTVSVLTGSDR
jgi:hypothetical protein